VTRERRVRAYANHLALKVRGPRGGPFVLVERYDDVALYRKRTIGTYHSVDALERAVERYAGLRGEPSEVPVFKGGNLSTLAGRSPESTTKNRTTQLFSPPALWKPSEEAAQG